MRLQFSCFVLSLTLFSVVSCSQKGSNVKLEISNSFVFGGTETSAIAGGGLMVWGQSSLGANFGQALEGSDSIDLQLPNGNWTFYAMAWDGLKDYSGSVSTNKKFGGTVRCAKSSTVLGGASASVDLSLTNAGCNDIAFAGNSMTLSGTAGDLKLPPVRFNFCSSIDNVSSAAHLCADSKKDPRQFARKAPVSSFRVKLRNHFSKDGQRILTSGGIAGECVEMTGDIETTPDANTSPSHTYGGSAIKVPGLPAGIPGSPFHMTVEMFVGSPDCDSSTGVRGVLTKELPAGAASSIPASNKYFAQSTTDHRQYLAVSPATVCNGRTAINLGDHSFAAGDGSTEHPYIICSVPQWHAINSSSSYMSKNFKLQADLDFNPFSKGLVSSTSLPPQFDCLEVGTNFMPVGYPSSTCSAGIMSWGAVSNFTGYLNGAGFSLKSPRFRDSDRSEVGLFASLSGSAEIGDFNVTGAEIEGAHTVGLIAGKSIGTATPPTINFWSIKASKVDVQARFEDPATESVVGGLIGLADKSSLWRVSLKDGKVRGVNSVVGGIIGHARYSTLNEVSAEVNLDVNSSVNSKQKIGGVIGFGESTLMDFVKHEGAIYTNAQRVGGIIGQADMAMTLTNFYANSFIFTNDSSTDVNIGGVVGYWAASTGASFGKGLSLSVVRSGCTSSCKQGAMAGYIQAPPATTYPSYNLPAAETGHIAGSSFSQQNSISSLAEMRLASTFTALDTAGANNWNILNGEYPRFDFENHPCVSNINGVNVSGSGAGTLTSPKIICNETQYLALGSAAANTYHKIAGSIRLSNSGTLAFDIPTFSAILDGNNKMLIGGYADVSGAAPTGHIGTVAAGAVIKNLQVHGLGRDANTGESLAVAHGPFVATNHGQLENLRLATFTEYYKFGSSAVGTNSTTGIMKNIRVEGQLRGFYSSYASLAVVNNGVIQDSKTNVELICIEGAGCDRISGLVVENNGSIKRTEMGSRLRQENNFPATNASMIVDTNNGLIEDVLVSEHSDFAVSDSPNYFHRLNNATGVLRRVVNNGSLKSGNKNYSPLLIGFPTEVTAASPGAGTHEDVIRRGGRSGKLLLENSSFTCDSVADRLQIGWGGITDYNNWNGALAAGEYVTLGQKLMAEIKFAGGITTTERILAYDETNYGFTIRAGRCPLGSSGEVSLWYTDDLAMDVAGNSTSGTMMPQSASYASNYSPTFQAEMWDSNEPDHMQEILDYHAYILGVSTTPVLPKVWELEESGLRLFNDKD